MIRAASPGGLRVLIADDHAEVRMLVARLLSRASDIEVVGAVASGEEALAVALELDPAVVLMDVSMPGIGGIEATRRLKGLIPHCRVVGHSSHDGAELMRDAGAEAFVAKGDGPEKLLQAIRGTS